MDYAVAQAVHLVPRQLRVRGLVILVGGAAQFAELTQVEHAGLHELAVRDEAVVIIALAVSEHLGHIARHLAHYDFISHKSSLP